MSVHHLLTVARSRPTLPANHFAVRLFSTNTIINRLILPFEVLLRLFVLSMLLALLIYLFLCVWRKIINSFCYIQKYHSLSRTRVIMWLLVVQIVRERRAPCCVFLTGSCKRWQWSSQGSVQCVMCRECPSE